MGAHHSPDLTMDAGAALTPPASGDLQPEKPDAAGGS